jgi:hypothetical protein
MNTEPKHNIFGVSLSEWIERVPNELPADAVGLWQIIPAGIDSFGLAGAELESFAKRCIFALIKSGAKPVVASAQKILSGSISRNMVVILKLLQTQ